MSAWTVGRTSTERRFSVLDSSESQFTAILNKVVRWIPGDVLALYVAGVTAIGVDRPSLSWLLVGLVLAPVIVLGSAYAANRAITRATAFSAVLALAATAVWSLTVPGSGWNRWSFVSDNPTGVTLVAAVAGLLFGLLADALVRKAPTV
jgi:hypothetical protein